jgi:hypothetical protein
VRQFGVDTHRTALREQLRPEDVIRFMAPEAGKVGAGAVPLQPDPGDGPPAGEPPPLGVIVFPGTGIQANVAWRAVQLATPVWSFEGGAYTPPHVGDEPHHAARLVTSASRSCLFRRSSYPGRYP